MERSEIESLVARWAAEAVAEGRTEVFDELLSEDVRDASDASEARGRESFKARARFVGAALEQRRVVVDALVVEGDRISWRWTLEATHSGPLFGVPATGKRVTLRGVNFQRLANGCVVEHWTLADFAGLTQQLRG